MGLLRERGIRAVTFDCWGTLIYEDPATGTPYAREDALVRWALAHGLELDRAMAVRALDDAWARHAAAWRARESSGAHEIARWALAAIGLDDPDTQAGYAEEIQEISRRYTIRALPGAQETLEALAGLGVRTGLICDTGISTGQTVREFLERVDLLRWLEVQVFSDEAGVPKPDPRVFHRALRALDTPPERALHVGDLRRSDIAGARRMGMSSVRIRAHNDDASEDCEADFVVGSHAELNELLAG